MYSISNKQRDDILTLLKAFAESNNDKSLQALNRCRRAMLLVRNLEKRKPYGKRLSLNK
ncbi:MAG: hypothetical protein J6U59_07735 [Alistipes sp.]|nr:hypothetical protein [Alistipes sp.]